MDLHHVYTAKPHANTMHLHAIGFQRVHQMENQLLHHARFAFALDLRL